MTFRLQSNGAKKVQNRRKKLMEIRSRSFFFFESLATKFGNSSLLNFSFGLRANYKKPTEPWPNFKKSFQSFENSTDGKTHRCTGRARRTTNEKVSFLQQETEGMGVGGENRT